MNLLRVLPAPLVGGLMYWVLVAVVSLLGILILPAAVLKLLAWPWPRLQRACTAYALWIASFWGPMNRAVGKALLGQTWTLNLPQNLDPNRSYLLIANHRSWVDILLIFDGLSRRAPVPRFFLKYELLYVPLIGSACWAMDFPFMRRHSREAVAANPALRLQDIETTRRACAVYKTQPVSVINFVEGTRFTEAKRVAFQSSYRHLLPPKTAGVAFALSAMGEQFAGVLDVTFGYRPARKTLLWSWLCGEQGALRVHTELLPIPADLLGGDYEGDAAFRQRFKNWMNDLWARKEARLQEWSKA